MELKDGLYRVKITSVKRNVAHGTFYNQREKVKIAISFNPSERKVINYLIKNKQELSMKVSDNGRTSRFVELPIM